jgi:hypothetical protein
MDPVIEKTIAALKKHSFNAVYAKDRDEARDLILKMVPPGARVGVPGSASVRATGVVEALLEKKHEVYDHWKQGLAPVETMKIRKQQLTCDVLLTSVNGLAMTGELVSMDGFGNRVAPMIFGPAKVIIVAGKNKIAPDLDAARERIRKIAAPKRARELTMKTPCAETNDCTDCNTPLRICRAEVILHRQPSMTPITVIVVDEELGN